jgi:hypothetical protein
VSGAATKDIAVRLQKDHPASAEVISNRYGVDLARESIHPAKGEVGPWVIGVWRHQVEAQWINTLRMTKRRNVGGQTEVEWSNLVFD